MRQVSFFFTAVARYIRSSFALAAEVGVYRNLWESWDTFEKPTEEVNRVISFMVGPRVSRQLQNGRARLFGQVFVGARMSNEVEASNDIQPGGGIDFRAGGMMVRFQLDYCIMRDPPPAPRSLSGTRSLIGVVVPLGVR